MQPGQDKVNSTFDSIRSEQGGTTKDGKIGDHGGGDVQSSYTGHESAKSAGVAGKEMPGGKK